MPVNEKGPKGPFFFLQERNSAPFQGAGDHGLRPPADPDFIVGIDFALDSAIAADFASLADRIAPAEPAQRSAAQQMRCDRGIGTARDRIFGDAVGWAKSTDNQHRVVAVAACENGEADGSR